MSNRGFNDLSTLFHTIAALEVTHEERSKNLTGNLSVISFA
jgi:hypothetical protein